MKDCAANGEIPSFSQLEDSFGLPGVVSLYFFSVFFFLLTLGLLVLTLAKLYRNVGWAEVRTEQSHRVLSYSWAPGLLSQSHPLRAQRPLSLPDDDGVGSPGEGSTLKRGLTIITNQANQFLHNVIQVYEAFVIHRLENCHLLHFWLNISDLPSNLWSGLEGKLEYWQRLIKIL